MIKRRIEQQVASIIQCNHPVPHPNQSIILPKQTMRNKRFADRITPEVLVFVENRF